MIGTNGRPGRAAGGLLVGLLLLATTMATPGSAGGEAGPRLPVRAPTAGLELVSQTPTVAPGGAFDLAVVGTGLPEDAYLEIVIHGRVRSRSELAQSMDGEAFRSDVHERRQLVTALPADADGARHLIVSLDPAAADGVRITTAGVYPVEVAVEDSSGTRLDGFVTHLIVRPGERDESPPLGVAVVADVDAPPALQPDGSSRLDADVIAALHGLTTALAETGDVPATIGARAETLDALAVAEDPLAAEILDLLPTAASGRAAVSLPYVDVAPDDLLTAGLRDELEHQIGRATPTIEDALGVRPTASSWLASRDLGGRGVSSLVDAGVRHLVVRPDQVEPLRAGILSLSLAQPFQLPVAGSSVVDALALDEQLLVHLEADLPAAVTVSRLLAELAVLWFEQPGIARAVVVPVDQSTDPAVVQGLLTALAVSGALQPVTLDDAFAAASPLRQPGGGTVERELLDGSPSASITREHAFLVAVQRGRLASLTGILGDTPRTSRLEEHLLLAVADQLERSERRAHLDAVGAAIDAVVAGVYVQARDTITLTARDGTVPLTLHNDTGGPVSVVVRASSSKLEFPDGDAVERTLTEAVTRLDLPVRARTSGSLSMDLTITSPDGALVFAEQEMVVQSTAISGVGALLSAGAAVFLLVWWARHWRRTRRSDKLVETSHPVLRDGQ